MKQDNNKAGKQKPLKKMTDRGFFFANASEASRGIYTRHNPDGTTIKSLVLPDSRKNAVVRQSTNRDQNEANRLASDGLRQVIALLSLCTMLENKRAGLADIEALSRADLLRLGSTYCLLNAKDWQTLVDRIQTEVIQQIANM